MIGAYKIIQYALEEQTDIFHLHGYKPNILIGLFPSFLRKIKTLSTLHGWTETRKLKIMYMYQVLDKILLRFKDAVVVVNPNIIPEVKKYLSNEKKLYVVENGIEKKLISNSEDSNLNNQRIIKFKKKSFLVGCIGRLSEEKGFDVALEAMQILINKKGNYKIVFIGDGNQKYNLLEITRKLNIENSCLFLGYIENADNYLQCFDCFLISSKTEGLPITLLEAMQNKVPVVSTKVGAIPNILTEDISGKLVDVDNAGQIAEAIHSLSVNKLLAEKIIKNAEIIQKENYSSSSMYSRYNIIYKKLLGRQ